MRAPSVAGLAAEVTRTKQDAQRCEGPSVAGLGAEVARTKQDARIGGADINAGHAIAWCLSFTMAGANVTGGVITGGDGADGGGGGEVVGVAAIVGGGEAVGVGDAAGGEDVAAGIADWASLVGKKAVMPLSQGRGWGWGHLDWRGWW